MMSNELRITMPMILAALVASFAAHAAEPLATPPREPGTLSQEATSAGPAVNTSAAPPAEATPAARRPATGGPQAVTRPNNDRLDLDTTVVTGNRELPKVLYIVPWKKSDLGDLPAQPFNTLLDEALTPVDRDVFRREVTYYGAVSNGGDSVRNTSPPPADRSEK